MIRLPKDAEGREIPLDTEVLYDECGTRVSVKEFLSGTLAESQKTEWTIKAAYEGNLCYNSFKPKNMHLTRPDTWERLLDDLSEAGDARYQEACAYFHRDKTKMAAHRAPVARTAAFELPCATSPTASFHCSDCGWDGQIWEHIGFGDMLAYEAVHCPKCGARIERRA